MKINCPYKSSFRGPEKHERTPKNITPSSTTRDSNGGATVGGNEMDEESSDKVVEKEYL